MKTDDFIMMPIPAAMFSAVCALLGGASSGAVAVSQRASPPIEPAAQPSGDAPASNSGAAPAASDAGADAGELDAGGWPWDPSLHASTKGKTKDGFWRMKVGVSRPEPKPGFPVAAGGTGTSSPGAGTAATDSAASGAAGPATTQTAGAGAGEDEDEFAAFRAAAEKAGATDAAAAANVPARKWTDADLGALCNQAAVKLGDPAPIKAIIAQHVPQGEVPHSRNIPDASREAFAQAVEGAAGITFAG